MPEKTDIFDCNSFQASINTFIIYYDYGSPIYKWKNWITNDLSYFPKFILA